MSIKTIRTALKTQLEDDSDLQTMFDNFIEEKRPDPSELDTITIRKAGSEEDKKEFGYNYKTSCTYSYEIIAMMKRNNIEDGDEAQIVSDQYIRQAIMADVSLGQTVAWVKIGKTIWGEDMSNNEIYYTIVPIECFIDESPTSRD